MAGLLGIGVALLAGAGLKIAAWTGALLLALMYLAEFPLGRTGMTNPLIDSHWIEALGIAVLRHDPRRGHLGPWQVVGPPRR